MATSFCRRESLTGIATVTEGPVLSQHSIVKLNTTIGNDGIPSIKHCDLKGNLLNVQ